MAGLLPVHRTRPASTGGRGLGTEKAGAVFPRAPPGRKEHQVKDWLIIALLAVAAGLVFSAVFPRYEWSVQGDGASVVVFDRWQGQSCAFRGFRSAS